MNAVAEAIAGDPTIGGLAAALALLVVAVALGWRRRLARLGSTIDAIERMAVGGQLHEAKVAARQAGRAVAPLLAAVGPTPAVEGNRGLGADALFAALPLAPLAGLVALAGVDLGDPERLAIRLIALWTLVTPVAVLGVVANVHLGLAHRRRLRGAAIRIVAARLNEDEGGS